MMLGKVRSVLILACLAASVWPTPARAYTSEQIKCATTIGKVGLGFVRAKLKLEQKCRLETLRGTPCAGPDAGTLAKLENGVRATLTKACTLPSMGLAGIGFPGPCADVDVGNGFTPDDLADCITSSHESIMSEMLALEFDPTVSGPLTKEPLACQREAAKQSLGFSACLLKAVQRCRAARLKEPLPKVPPHLCATDDPTTAATIAKCRAKMTDAIQAKCTDADAQSLGICTPDQTSAAGAATCLADEHAVRIDGPAIDVPPDLIDYEYAVRGGLCGDGVVNSLAEECDGSDDSACPGACGTALSPNGYFACLCTTKPRMRVVEHADADTDNGWTGNSADQGVAEGGGYLTDLYDCDGFGNCIVGPSCSLPPHSPCNVLLSSSSGTTGNQLCALYGQGTCRKERTATGPHCFQDVQKKCDPDELADPVCNEPGDYCATTLVAPPNPVSSGGVTVCNVTIFSEDVVGTVNLTTGQSVVRAPQRSRTYGRSIGSANKPCPVCGGFCAISRERCTTNAECGINKGPCVTAPVCSDGPNAGKACRTVTPFGSASEFFGTTSVDCPPSPNTEITSSGGLDLYIPLRSTGTVTLAPTVPCGNASFAGNRCIGGTNAGRACGDPSECPGGTCSPQCFCAGQLKPNACAPACLGGSSDAAECTDDSECPGGFCHPADCRVDAGDDGSAQEGICTVGPVDAWCSATTYRPCLNDAECAPPNCPFCQAGETCISRRRACFVNGGIVRQGAPRTPEGVSVGIYCIAGDNAAVNTVAGFPGPAAFTQPELEVSVP